MRSKSEDNGIKRIAKQLQLSVSTVSRALNDVYGVKAETRERVKEAAKATGYVPHMGAKQLVGKSSALIAVFAPRFESEASPGFLALFGALQQALAEFRKDVILFSVPFLNCPEGRLSESIGSRGIEGCILLPAILEWHPVMKEALELQIPCVNFEGVVGPRCSSVSSDDQEGGRLAGRLLASKGHRRVGYIMGPPQARVCIERYEGFCEALRESELTPDPTLVAQGDFTGMSGAAAVKELLRAAPDVTGIYCANDLMAMGAVMELTRMGISVPGRISVVGHDGDFFTAYTNPPLTTVSHNHSAMGSRAASLMIDLLEGGRGRGELNGPILVERATVDIPPPSEISKMEDTK